MNVLLGLINVVVSSTSLTLFVISGDYVLLFSVFFNLGCAWMMLVKEK